MYKFLLCLFIMICFNIKNYLTGEELQKSNIGASFTKDFFLLTIPKSGSHLAIKSLVMLTGFSYDISIEDKEKATFAKNKEIYEKFMLEIRAKKTFTWTHTSFRENDLLWEFNKTHPEYIKFLQVRDLKDIFLSLIHWVWPVFPNSTFNNMDEALTALLSMSPKAKDQADALKKCIEGMINWIDQPNTILVRFEDLVGSEGGGNQISQQETILRIASSLGIDVSSDKLQAITRDLFGNKSGPHVSITFRNGKVGAWRAYFKPYHIKLFNQNWGHYQLALGYSI